MRVRAAAARDPDDIVHSSSLWSLVFALFKYTILKESAYCYGNDIVRVFTLKDRTLSTS